jgi:hypothetical protein
LGSTQDIAKKKFNRRLKWLLLLLSPLLVLGVSSISFQFMKLLSNEDFKLADVDVTNLWPYKSPEVQFEQAAVEEDLTRPSLRTVAKAIGENIPRKVNAPKPPLPLLKPKLSKTVLGKKMNPTTPAVFQPAEIKPISLESIPRVSMYDVLPSGKYINLSDKKYLISKDLDFRRGKWSIGASFSPNYTYRTLSYYDVNAVASRIDDGVAYIDGQSSGYRNNHDKPLINFSTGIDVYYHISDRWTISTGLQYTSLGEQLQVVRSPNNLQKARSAGSSPMDDNHYLSPENTSYDDLDKIPFNNYYGLLEIPLRVEYRIFEKNGLSITGQTGITYSRLDHVDALLYDYESKQYNWHSSSGSSHFNQQLWSLGAGISLNQFISQEVEIFASPRFRYFHTPTFSESYEIRQNQWLAGMRLGLLYHFKQRNY